MAGQDTGRDGRRSNRNREVTASMGKTIGKRRDTIGTTRRETARGKHKGFVLRGWGERRHTGPGKKGTLIQGGTGTRGSTRYFYSGTGRARLYTKVPRGYYFSETRLTGASTAGRDFNDATCVDHVKRLPKREGVISAHPRKWGGLPAEGGIVGKVQGRSGQVWGSRGTGWSFEVASGDTSWEVTRYRSGKT